MTRRRGQVPTWTCQVESLLRSCDDFASVSDLCAATGGTPNQVTAALHSLRQYRVVGVEITPDGKGWWYARPQEEDTRLRHVEERALEDKPRRRRKTKPQLTIGDPT